MAGNRYMRLGDMLVSKGALEEEQLQEALAIQRETHERLGTVLIDNKYITEAQLVETLSLQLGIEYIDLSEHEAAPGIGKYIPRGFAITYRVVPVKATADTLYIAMQDPLNFEAIEEAGRISQMRIVPMIGTEHGISHGIKVLYGNEGTAEAITQMKEEAGVWNDAISENSENAGKVDKSTSSGPTKMFVDSIIERAYREDASDIHFEPSAEDMRIRMRIDGRLRTILTVPQELQDSVVARLKVMSRMNIVERRVPQDGRASLEVDGCLLDLRVSTLPTIFGEKVVIRLLSQNPGMLVRSGIGIPEHESAKLDKLMAITSGVILIVGPTGSGKSSTMYTLIKELLDESTNLVTLEDPVESIIDGACQVNINEKTGLTFASGLRSILRQDPDVVCIGEIRDGETAEIAMRAAMTGHKVISTIHTESAIAAIDRLKDMGVEPYLISGGLAGVISQRLVRKVCPNCREEYRPEDSVLRIAGIDPKSNRKFYHGKGCEQCFSSGYRGRTGVFEILAVNQKIKNAIAHEADNEEFMKIIENEDFITMQETADKMIDDGITTVEEVIRVLGSTDF